MIQISLTNTIENSDFSATDGKQLDKTRQWHVFNDMTNFGQNEASTPVACIVKLFVAQYAGTLLNVSALLKDCGTSGGPSTFDIKKNGTSMLTSVISIPYTGTDDTPVVGTLHSTNKVYAAGDLITAHITAVSTGALGAVLFTRREEQGN